MKGEVERNSTERLPRASGVHVSTVHNKVIIPEATSVLPIFTFDYKTRLLLVRRDTKQEPATRHNPLDEAASPAISLSDTQNDKIWINSKKINNACSRYKRIGGNAKLRGFRGNYDLGLIFH